MYKKVIEALEERNAVIHASGYLQYDRAKRTVSEMNVDRIDKVEPLTDDEVSSLFGIASNMTGDLTTEKFIERIRHDG